MPLVDPPMKTCRSSATFTLHPMWSRPNCVILSERKKYERRNPSAHFARFCRGRCPQTSWSQRVRRARPVPSGFSVTLCARSAPPPPWWHPLRGSRRMTRWTPPYTILIRLARVSRGRRHGALRSYRNRIILSSPAISCRPSSAW